MSKVYIEYECLKFKKCCLLCKYFCKERCIINKQPNKDYCDRFEVCEKLEDFYDIIDYNDIIWIPKCCGLCEYYNECQFCSLKKYYTSSGCVCSDFVIDEYLNEILPIIGDRK